MFDYIKHHNSKYKHESNIVVINFVGIISILYTIFLVAELYIDHSANNPVLWVAVDTFVCVVFLYEYFYFFFKTKNKRDYFMRHWIDFFASIPFMLIFGTSVFGPILTIFKLFRGLKNLIKLYEFVLKKKTSKLLTLTAFFIIIVVYFSIILVEVEGQNNEKLSTFHDSVWYVLTTITTVGFGDVVPKTIIGRAISAFLMMFGIGISAGFGALLVSRLLKPIEERVYKEEGVIEKRQYTSSQLNRKILSKLDKMEREIKDLKKDK